LYGLKSLGKRWHERFFDILCDLGFTPSKADSDVWMRRVGNLYEYLAVWVDDLCIASKDPKGIINALQEHAQLKLKGVGPLSYHLGCDFTRDPDGTLSYGPRRYIAKLLEGYKRRFGEEARNASSPLVKNDHPEVDESPLIDTAGTVIYQSLIGELLWCIALGRFELLPAVMTMGRFRICPRQGHLDRVKRIYGFLRKYPHGAIRVRTGLPDYSDLEYKEHDWYDLYGNVEELIPYDAPEPLGKAVIVTTYEDANLYHDLVTGRAVTGILHFLNGTPIEWFSKRQDTVESATYGSEFVAARIATEQIIDLRITLRYLGIPLEGPAYMFGDNQSVVISGTIPHLKLNKRHNALSYHRVREAVVAQVIRFCPIAGVKNPADILSKHCGFPQLWSHLRPLLFWLGNPTECPEPKQPKVTIAPHERVEI
jgi:hypothetical protein